MGIVSLLFLSIGLAMDAVAVSITCGANVKELRIAHAFRVAIVFAFFQALMPIIGCCCAMYVKKYIEPFDHWIILGLLGFIGSKMIYESLIIDQEKKDCAIDRSSLLLILAIATSIDALAVGVGFALIHVSLILAVALIGCVTFTMCFGAVGIGNKLGHLFENKIEIIGGIILISIGIKIFLQHVFS